MAMITEEMRACIAHCDSCAQTCTEMVMHCLHLGGAHAAPGHIGILLDCAQICRTSADFLLRSSHLHGRTCAVCAEVCDRCALSCAQWIDDPTMQACAEACRSCADSCRRMADRPLVMAA